MSINIKVSARINGETVWFDITDDLKRAGAKLPADVSVPGIYPDDAITDPDDPLFYDLLGAIATHSDSRLAENFFDGRVHGIMIEDSARNAAFEARLLVETRYGSRNA